jgi:hypothetical protein
MMNAVATVAFAACGLVADPAGAQPTQPAPADLPSVRPPWGSELRVALAYSPWRRTRFLGEGPHGDVETFDAGIEAEYFHVSTRVFHLGVGLRYGVGAGPPSFGNHAGEIEHLAFLPLLVGWSSRSDDTGDELGINLGLGPAFGAISIYDRSQYVRTGGIGVEIGATFVHPVSRDLAFTAGLTVRLMTLSALADTWGAYFAHGLHYEVPLHAGVRYRL